MSDEKPKTEIQILRDTIDLVDKKSRDDKQPDMTKRLIAIDRITANGLEQADEARKGFILKKNQRLQILRQ